nr:sensor histidine kinase [Verticiella sp. GG226]
MCLALLACLIAPARGDGLTLRIDALPPELATLSPADVMQGAYDEQFAPFARERAPGFGPPLWLRLTLPQALPEAGEYVLELRTPFVNRFDVYVRGPQGAVQHETAGNMVQRTANAMPYQYPAFRLDLTEDPGPIYVRMDTLTTRAFSAHLWEPVDFGSQARLRYLAQGALFGVFFAFGLLFLVVGAQARSPGFVVYAIYVMGSALVNALAQGLIGPLPAPLYNPIVGFGACVTIGLNAELLRIARLDRHHPRLSRGYRLGCWAISACMIPVAITGHFQIISPITQVLYIVQAALGCVVGAMLWHRGEPAGRAFLLGFLVMHVTLLAFVLQNLGLIAPVAWTPLGMVLGAFGHFAMMSIVMAQRMRSLGRQREVAQLALLESMRHNELQLEQRVQERTAALRREMRRRQSAETELRAAHLRTEQALVAEREANQRQRDVFRMMSHDFRTPLSVLAATVGATGSPTDETRQARARRAVNQLQEMVDTSLAADAFDGLETSFTMSAVDLEPLVAEVVRRMEDLERAPRIRCTLDAHCVVRGDALWLRILLTNLLHNAAHHTPPGTRVYVRASRYDELVTVTVEDDGPGLPVQDMAALGRRFQRPAHTDGSGSGIGLYAVREIVERHGGDVNFDSSPLGGLRVSFTLPCAGDDASALSQDAPHAQAS